MSFINTILLFIGLTLMIGGGIFYFLNKGYDQISENSKITNQTNTDDYYITTTDGDILVKNGKKYYGTNQVVRYKKKDITKNDKVYKGEGYVVTGIFTDTDKLKNISIGAFVIGLLILILDGVVNMFKKEEQKKEEQKKEQVQKLQNNMPTQFCLTGNWQ